MNLLKKQAAVTALSVPIALSLLGGHDASAAKALPAAALPAAPSWGYFVDQYKNNVKTNLTVESNPTIGVLSGYTELWTPGATWDTGTKLNAAVLDRNIQTVADIAAKRTPEEEQAAYLDDRRQQSYSVIDGLGSLADVYRAGAGATTTIKDVAADATTTLYNDEGTNAGDPKSSLGSIVTLVNTLRGDYSSTTPAKNFYNYPRPFRWLDKSLVIPTLVPAIKDDPSSDGGFPSGHTNAAYLASLAMAYAVPERFQELLTRASELGNNRIVAGMHSPLDVMGGRTMATALAAAILSDPDNAELKQAAYADAHTKLLTQTGTSADLYGDYEKNKQDYRYRLTYDFTRDAANPTPMVVPKGAEVLLETRLPYLDATQRRWVLATTGLPSGYPLLNDPEGWGRLNLFAAADGYGAFIGNVKVNMDASRGGFNAADSWRNDIYGGGRLTKQGDGTLKLAGHNSYWGGTRIEKGTLEADSATAFGAANVTNIGGTVSEKVNGAWTIAGHFKQTANGVLEMTIGSRGDLLQIGRTATLGGKLRLSFANGYVPADGETIIRFAKRTGTFSSVEVSGLPSGYKANVSYSAKGIQLKVTK